VISQVGKGTHVICPPDSGKLQVPPPLRRAKMVYRAESFLLKSLIAGYSFKEIEESIDLARRHVQSL
jgi:hypothetical protein